jgi:hypothetical protein
MDHAGDTIPKTVLPEKGGKWRRKNRSADLKALEATMLWAWRRKSKVKRGKRVSPGERTEVGSLVARVKKWSAKGGRVDID